MKFDYTNKRERVILTIIHWFLAACLISLPILAILMDLHPFYLAIALVPAGVGIGSIVKELITRRYLSKIKIDSEGIECISKKKNVKMQWYDVALVGMAKTPAKLRSRIIIFSTINSEEELSKQLDIDKIDEDHIFCFYSKELLEQIKKYWQDEIVDEDKIRDFS